MSAENLNHPAPPATTHLLKNMFSVCMSEASPDWWARFVAACASGSKSPAPVSKGNCFMCGEAIAADDSCACFPNDLQSAK